MNLNYSHALNHELREFHDNSFGVGHGEFQEFATVEGIDRSACPNPKWAQRARHQMSFLCFIIMKAHHGN